MEVAKLSQGSFCSQGYAIHKIQIFGVQIGLGGSGEFKECPSVSSLHFGVQMLLEKALNACLCHRACKYLNLPQLPNER